MGAWQERGGWCFWGIGEWTLYFCLIWGSKCCYLEWLLSYLIIVLSVWILLWLFCLPNSKTSNVSKKSLHYAVFCLDLFLWVFIVQVSSRFTCHFFSNWIIFRSFYYREHLLLNVSNVNRKMLNSSSILMVAFSVQKWKIFETHFLPK